MDPPDEKVLIANGIVRSNESKQFHCSICTSDTYFDNWKNHIEATSHVNILERFKLSFRTFGFNKKEVQCKICKSTVTWETLKIHAISHKITPWYELDDLYKIFFEHHMMQWSDQFYCFSCDSVFREWSAAYLHIDEERHKNRINAVLPENKMLSLNGSNLSYKSLVSNAVISWDSTNIACKICKCFGMGMQNFVQHVKGFRHLNSRFILISNLKKRINELTANIKRPSDNPEKSNNIDKPIETKNEKQPVDGSEYPIMFDDYIEQDNATDFHCSICECIINGRTNIEVHAAGKRHKKFLNEYRKNKITFMGGYDFYCECCRHKIRGINQVDLHIAGSGHEIASPTETNQSENKEFWNQNLDSEFKLISSSTDPLNQSIATMTQQLDNPEKGVNNDKPMKTKKKKQPVDDAVYPIMFDDYIVQKTRMQFHCTICYRFMRSRLNIERHAASKEHKKVLKEFRENKISFMEGNDFYCECCRCKIPRLVNVHRHRAGRSHKIALSRGTNLSKEKELLNPDSDSKIANTAGPSDNPEGRKSNNKQIMTEMKEQLVDGFVYPMMFNDYVQQDSVIQFYCTICSRVISGCSNIDCHAAGKTHVQRLEKFCKNKISFIEGYDYYCGYCKCKIYSMDNVDSHIDGPIHKIYASGEKNCPNNKDVPKSNEILNTLNEQKQSENLHVPKSESSAYNNIVISNTKMAHCKICNSHISYSSNSDIEEHIMGTQHLSALNLFHENKISFTKGDKYHCVYCNCSIFSYLTVREHIKGHRHAHLSGKSNEPNQTVKPSSEKCSCNYVVKLTNSASCRICDCTITGQQKAIDEHVAGKNHMIALKKYGCDKISISNGSKQYYCKSCNAIISGIENLCAHVKGERHESALNLSIGVRTTINKNPVVATSARPSKSMVLPRCNGFSNMPIKLIPKKPRNSRQKFVNMIWEAQLRKLADPVDCSVCGIEVANVVEVHSHLARHFNEDFNFSNIDMSNDKNIDNRKGDKKKIATSFNSSTESLSTLASDSEYFNSSETPEIVLKRTNEPGRLERTPKKANMKRIVQHLDFEDDDIYSMKDKLRELELGMQLCFVTGSEKIYCLVCQKVIDNTIDNYFKHLCSLDHIVYLERMERDDALFWQYPEQFSLIDLGLEYMEEISDSIVRCHICSEEMDNLDDILNSHIENELHSQKWENMHATALQNFEHIKLRLQCNWYKVERYRCIPCLLTFRSEFNFAAHLKSKKHLNIMESRVNSKRQLIIDFCEACALLWYGYRRTYAYHCDIETHVWLIRDGYYVSGELPKKAKELLVEPEEYIDDTIKRYDEISDREREKEIILIRDIEKTVKWKFPLAKAYIFGSRVTGVGSPDSDIDVFLDCGNMYDGKISSSEDKILCYMDGVTECLTEDPESWVIEELLKTCRSPIIKVHHRLTGLSCDISFENGLAVENTALIKSFNDAFPLCRKMILFLKRWLALCKLSGSDRITSYALYWHVIFYLQKESIFPSVATLISMKNESYTIAGWEVGVARNFTYNKLESIFSINELLKRFFTFWANFDYRYDVACPIIGEIVKKRTFVKPQDLPKEMAPYVDYIRTSKFPDPLRIDSTMCIQDPFDLQHNLTKAVNKIYVNHFRSYCLKSLDVLCSL